METRIKHGKKRDHIELVIDDGAKDGSEKTVLAAMTLFEGTGCWVLMDVRLSKNKTPGPCACGLRGDAVHATYEPESEEEAEFVKSLLKECQEDDDGAIHWCTYDGIVRGSLEVNGYTPSFGSKPQIFMKRSDALEKLNEIKAFWDAYEGDPKLAKIDNPYRQPSEMHVHAACFSRREIESPGSRM